MTTLITFTDANKYGYGDKTLTPEIREIKTLEELCQLIKEFKEQLVITTADNYQFERIKERYSKYSFELHVEIYNDYRE